MRREGKQTNKQSKFKGRKRSGGRGREAKSQGRKTEKIWNKYV
jgi:hypothetical protein